ncbi:MAG: hypothetical protein ACOZIN_03625 [Myxococcota bacterium]
MRSILKDAAAAASVFSATFVLSLAPVADPDAFWHLAIGRHIASTGSLPRTNLWSFTTPEHSFDPTSWLFGLCAHLLERAAGLEGLHVAIALTIALAFAVVYATGRILGASPLLTCSLTLAAAAAFQARYTLRPHAVSYLFLAVLAMLLVLARRGRTRVLWGVPPLIALWVNFHAGAVFGVGAVACLLVARVFERLRSSGTRSPPLAACVWCTAASSIALLATPLGWEILRYTGWHHLAEVGFIGELAEFTVPGPSRYLLFWILLALGGVALGKEGRRADSFAVALLLGFGLLAIRAVRVGPKFLIVTIPWVAAALSTVECPGFLRKLLERIPLHLKPALAALLPGASLIAALWVGERPLQHYLRRVQLGVDPFRVPVAAARFARAAGISGRCFTSWEVSGFVEWALPESPVFHDPRLLAYPSWVFDELSRAEHSQEAFDELMRKFDVEWVLQNHAPVRLSGRGRFKAPRWALVYWDEASALYVRRDIPRFADIIARNEFTLFTPEASVPRMWWSTRGAARARLAEEVSRAVSHSPRFAAAHTARCLERADAGDLSLAISACAQAGYALEQYERFNPRYQQRRQELAAALINLAEAAERQGGTEEAAHAYEEALKIAGPRK